MAHAEYCCAHGNNQTDNWNWTVPYSSTWHFVFDFRQTFQEQCYWCITHYFIGTEYREVTDFRDVEKTIIPSYCTYLAIGLLTIGALILGVGYLSKKER
jgi:hypothetical protein